MTLGLESDSEVFVATQSLTTIFLVAIIKRVHAMGPEKIIARQVIIIL